MKDEEINARFYEFGRRIAEFDEVREDIKLFKNQIESISKSIQELKEKIKQEKEETEKITSHIQLNQNKSYSFLNNLLESIDSLKESQKDLTKNIQNLQVFSNSNDSKISELLKNQKEIYSQIYNNKNYCSENYSTKESIKDFKDLFLNFSTKSNSEVYSIKEEIKKIDKISEIQSIESSHIEKKFSVLESRIQSSISSAKVDIERVFSSDLMNLREKISQIKIPSIDHLAEKSSFDSLTNQIQYASLDAKNALLKSGNLEVQYQINSKKLENISLILQKIELEKKV